MRIYLWSEFGLCTGSEEVEETARMPLRSTPTPPPKLTGTQVARWTGSSWEKLAKAPEPAPAPEAPQPTSAQIDAERDRRIDGGFMFQGKLIQSGPDDRENISGSALTAFMAKSAGVPDDELKWDGTDADFYWITQDNSKLFLGPQGVIDLGLAATNHKAAHIRAGFALKEADSRPTDFTDDRYWPERPEAQPVTSTRSA